MEKIYKFQYDGWLGSMAKGLFQGLVATRLAQYNGNAKAWEDAGDREKELEDLAELAIEATEIFFNKDHERRNRL